MSSMNITLYFGLLRELLSSHALRRVWDPRCPAAVQVAKPRVAIPVGLPLDVLVPQDLQRDVLVLQLPMDRGEIGLGAPAVALLGADRGKELRLEHSVG